MNKMRLHDSSSSLSRLLNQYKNEKKTLLKDKASSHINLNNK
jgi:hypothetical protein